MLQDMLRTNLLITSPTSLKKKKKKKKKVQIENEKMIKAIHSRDVDPYGN